MLRDMKYSMIERNIAYMFFCQQNIFETYRHTCCTYSWFQSFQSTKCLLYLWRMSFWVDNLIKSNERSKQRLQTVNYSCRGGRKVYEFEYCCSITIAVMVTTTTYPHSIVKLLFSRSNTFLLLHGNLLWNSLLIK